MVQNFTLLKKAAVAYLCAFCLQRWNGKNSLLVDQASIVVNNKEQSLFLPIVDDVKNELDADSRKQIAKFFDKEDGISALSFFLEQTLLRLEAKLKQLKKAQGVAVDRNQLQQEISEQDIIGDHMNQFKLQFMGCSEHCPLCRRQCDKQHKENQNVESIKHGCDSGHQMQALGGSYNSHDKKAITLSCSELDNADMVDFEGTPIKWVLFREKPLLRNWLFEADKNDQQINRDKNVKIWNLLGKDICRLYN